MAKQAEPSHLPPPQVPSSPLPSSSAPQHNTSTPSTPPQVTGSSRDWLGHWAIARRAAQVSVDLLRLDVRVGRGREHSREELARMHAGGCERFRGGAGLRAAVARTITNHKFLQKQSQEEVHDWSSDESSDGAEYGDD